MITSPLTSLRFIAAIIVVIFHYGSGTGLAQLAQGVLTAGQSMVIFFFVLSGFVMTIAYLRKDSFSTRDYWVARLARVAPIYFLALIVAAYITLSPKVEDGWVYGGDVVVGVLLNATFLQAWFPPYPLSINTPAWSLSTEIFFYSMFPLIIVFLRKVQPKVINVVAFSFFIFLITQISLMNLHTSDMFEMPPSKIYDLIYFFPLFHLGTFLIGVAAGYLMITKNFEKKSLQYGHLWTVLTIVCVGVIILVLSNRGYLMSVFGYESSLLAPVYAVFFVLIVQPKNILAIPFRSKFFLILGEASYSIYILQDPLHDLFKAFIQPYLGMGSSAQFYVFTTILVVTSIFTFYFVEKPSKIVILNAYKKIRNTNIKSVPSIGLS